jgi:hypothetical protein
MAEYTYEATLLEIKVEVGDVTYVGKITEKELKIEIMQALSEDNPFIRMITDKCEKNEPPRSHVVLL